MKSTFLESFNDQFSVKKMFIRDSLLFTHYMDLFLWIRGNIIPEQKQNQQNI